MSKPHSMQPTSLLHSYACEIGRSEALSKAEIDSLPEASVRRTALLLGRGCMMVLHRNERHARWVFEAVKDATARFTKPRNLVERTQRRHYLLADMLAHPDDALRVLRRRKQIHYVGASDASAALAHSRQQWRDSNPNQRRRMAGRTAEHTINGLLTRRISDSVLATPSLTQHDRGLQGKRWNNYDGLLLRSSDVQSHNTAYRLQSKLGCLGLCEQPEVPIVNRRRYGPGITLVSGHCDLGMYIDASGEWQSPLTDLLIREANGGATPDQIAQLDVATSNLLQSISDDQELRQGTRGVPRLALSCAA